MFSLLVIVLDISGFVGKKKNLLLPIGDEMKAVIHGRFMLLSLTLK